MVGKMIDRWRVVAVVSCVMKACQESAKMMLLEQQRSLLRHMDFLAHIPHVDLRYQMLPTSSPAHSPKSASGAFFTREIGVAPSFIQEVLYLSLSNRMTYMQSRCKASECI
jgi:hypothetical protein